MEAILLLFYKREAFPLRNLYAEGCKCLISICDNHKYFWFRVTRSLESREYSGTLDI